MSSFGKILDLVDDRYLNLQDVFGNVEPLPSLVPYEQYVHNMILYRIDTNHEIYMALLQDFTDRSVRGAQKRSKESWTWCVQLEVPKSTADPPGTPAAKKQRIDAQGDSTKPEPAQPKKPALTIIERRCLHPELFQEENILRILIDIVQVDSKLVPNYVEFLYQWIDYYEGGGKALKAALRMEIPSLWLFEYHPRPLWRNDGKYREDEGLDRAAAKMGEKLPRTKPLALEEMESLTEQSERLQYREVKFGIQRPIDLRDEPIPPLINVPYEQKKRQQYYASCFKNRQRAFWLLQEASVTARQIANYKKLQPMGPKETPEDINGNGFLNYYKEEPYAHAQYLDNQHYKELREKQNEVALSRRLAEEARIAAQANATMKDSKLPPALIPLTPAQQSGRPDVVAAFWAKIKSIERDRDPPVQFVPSSLFGKMKSKVFEHAKARTPLPEPQVPTDVEMSDSDDDDDDDESDDGWDYSGDDIDPDERDNDHADMIPGTFNFTLPPPPSLPRLPADVAPTAPVDPPVSTNVDGSRASSVDDLLNGLTGEQIVNMIPLLNTNQREMLRRQFLAENPEARGPIPGPGYTAPRSFSGPTIGQPLQGQPLQGQPLQGQPLQGQPLQGQPLQGQPLQGQPLQGQPLQGQPLQGQTAPTPTGGAPAMSLMNQAMQQHPMMQSMARMHSQMLGQGSAPSSPYPGVRSASASMGTRPPGPNPYLPSPSPLPQMQSSAASGSSMGARPMVPNSYLPPPLPHTQQSGNAGPSMGTHPMPANPYIPRLRPQTQESSNSGALLGAYPLPPNPYRQSLYPQMQPNTTPSSTTSDIGQYAGARRSVSSPLATGSTAATMQSVQGDGPAARAFAAIQQAQSRPMGYNGKEGSQPMRPSTASTQNFPTISVTQPQTGNPTHNNMLQRMPSPGSWNLRLNQALHQSAVPAGLSQQPSEFPNTPQQRPSALGRVHPSSISQNSSVFLNAPLFAQRPSQSLSQSANRAPPPPSLNLQVPQSGRPSDPSPYSDPPKKSPIPITPLAGLTNKLSLNSPQAASPHGIPIQLYIPKIVLSHGADFDSATDCLVLGYTRPETGILTLSKAIFFPTTIWDNLLNRVRRGHAEVLETYAPPPNHPRFVAGQGTLRNPDDVRGPHRFVYEKLRQVYALMVDHADREEQVTKRWRTTPGPMTARDRGSVWEGWGLYVDRAVEMGYEERQGVGGHVSRSLDGRKGFGISAEEEAEKERRRREIDELLDEEFEDDDEDLTEE